MKCKCWMKLTLFSKDYLSHSILLSSLSSRGLQFIQDEKLLDIRLNLPCPDLEVLGKDISPHVREGYGMVDIKCWGSETDRLIRAPNISIPGFHIVPIRSEKKEIKLRLLPESIKSSGGFDIKTIESISERAFLISLDSLLKLLPSIKEALSKMNANNP